MQIDNVPIKQMIRIFKYIEELDCFVANPAYKDIADYLGLNEMGEMAWIGRFFTMDNDFGEHWFDNWDLREAIEEKAGKMGFDVTELYFVEADRFKDNKDGPCHTWTARALFWKDVLMSLHLGHETIFLEARKLNSERQVLIPEEYIDDLEDRIQKIRDNN